MAEAKSIGSLRTNMQDQGQVFLAALLRNSEMLVTIGSVGVVLMMILPLPTILLDILIALNLSISFLVLIISMNTTNILDFSVFPSLLLITTLFRLALNVSSTRLILLQGLNFDGEIIRQFGDFVVGGNYVVGIVIFLILVIIQFMVITKGSTRVAEVAARFTLDAMPGKQMSIDSDLQAGLIDDDEAKKKRKDLQREADFYGAMDGASKFVQGDAIAGIIITIINIAGGLVIGVLQRGEPVGVALQTYALLTVGDGLVSQIPALLISTATGIIVTRAASESNLGGELTKQFTNDPKIMLIVSAMMGVLGLVPGLPKVPFFTLAILIGTIGYLMIDSQRIEKTTAIEEEEKQEHEKAKQPESMASLLSVDPMELEIGYSLIPLVDNSQGGDLLERITMIRRQTAMDLGLVVPPIRIRDNMQLKPNSYAIKIKGSEVATGSLHGDQYLAINPGTGAEPLLGEQTTEPTFGLPATWITEDQRERAEMLGYTVVDSPSVIATHLTETIKIHAHEILGREEVQTLIDSVRQNYPLIVDELVPKEISLGQLQEILANLLREGISIRYMVQILEALSLAKARKVTSTEFMTELVRGALKNQITAKYQVDKTLHVITLDGRLTQLLESSLREINDSAQIIIDDKQARKLKEAIRKEGMKANQQGLPPVILTQPTLRPYLKHFLEWDMPSIAVISINEIASGYGVEGIGVINI